MPQLRTSRLSLRPLSTGDAPVMFAMIIFLTVVSIILTDAAKYLEMRMQRWKTA